MFLLHHWSSLCNREIATQNLIPSLFSLTLSLFYYRSLILYTACGLEQMLAKSGPLLTPIIDYVNFMHLMGSYVFEYRLRNFV